MGQTVPSIVATGKARSPTVDSRVQRTVYWQLGYAVLSHQLGLYNMMYHIPIFAQFLASI